MKQTLQALILILLLSFVAACNIGRGFRGPQDDNVSWTSRHFSSQQEIDMALYSCGVVGLSEGLGVDRSHNGRAIIEECMFKKKFYRESGFGGVCSLPSYRPELPACANAPIRSRNSYYGN
jgi:hypothetical protein